MLRVATIRRQARTFAAAVSAVDARSLATLESDYTDLAPVAAAFRSTVKKTAHRVHAAEGRAKELEIQLKVANAERQQAQAIIYSITDAVLVSDRFDDVVLANDSAGKLLGFDMNDTSRRAIDVVVSDATLVSMIREMRQSKSLNGRRIVEHTFGTGESARACKITLSCVGDQAGEISGVVTVIHDMTREKEISRMKNDFVSHVSHELRTPLASIKAYVEMLVDGEAQDEKTRRDFYDVIQNEANRLSRLIDNILNISRIESGLVKINKQPTSLMVVLKQAIEVVTPQARGKNIVIEEQLEPAFYQTFGDRDMLYQAVMNLLGNAIKYTPENGRITVQTVANESSNSVTVRITDTGVGIPEKALPFLFDKFYRVEENNHMGKGTGLGLSLVKHIVETVHRGQVFVESTAGKGSTFGFTLELTR
jgi:two-component system phosphate regulon sensor histidine kinase PhoR